MEEWKEIEGYPNYQVSNMGRVKSLERVDNNNHLVKERILKSGKQKNGYLKVSLCKEGKMRSYLVHRLVASTFIPNTDNLPQVNHKDEDKTNNCVDNLEWCDGKYNINYGTCIQRMKEKSNSISILQFSKTGEFVKIWNNTREAERELGIYNGNICSCLKGKRKTAGNFGWCYAVINGFTIDINKLKKVA